MKGIFNQLDYFMVKFIEVNFSKYFHDENQILTIFFSK